MDANDGRFDASGTASPVAGRAELPPELERRLIDLSARVISEQARLPAPDEFWSWLRREVTALEALTTSTGDRATLRMRVVLLLSEHHAPVRSDTHVHQDH